MNDTDNDFDSGKTIVVIGTGSLWRDCLVQCLEFDGYAVVPFTNVPAWLEVRVRYTKPDVILLSDPDHSAMTLMSRVAATAPTIVICEGHGSAGIGNLIHQGVRGIIPPATTTLNVALSAIRLVESGGVFVPPDLPAKKDARMEFGALLTERQMEVVDAVRQGKANKEIAQDLNLRESTVKVHVRQIMRKLDAKNRTEIAVLANELLEIGRSFREEA